MNESRTNEPSSIGRRAPRSMWIQGLLVYDADGGRRMIVGAMKTSIS